MRSRREWGGYYRVAHHTGLRPTEIRSPCHKLVACLHKIHDSKVCRNRPDYLGPARCVLTYVQGRTPPTSPSQTHNLRCIQWAYATPIHAPSGRGPQAAEVMSQEFPFFVFTHGEWGTGFHPSPPPPISVRVFVRSPAPFSWCRVVFTQTTAAKQMQLVLPLALPMERQGEAWDVSQERVRGLRTVAEGWRVLDGPGCTRREGGGGRGSGAQKLVSQK